MKKIILGLVLLVITGCGGSFSPGVNIGDILPLGSTKEQACKSKYVETREFYGTPRALCHSFWDANYKYYPSSKIEIISNGYNNVFLVYADVNQKMECINLFCKYGDGKLIKITRSFEDAELYTDTAKLAEFKKKEEQEKIVKDLEAKKLFAQQEQQRKILEADRAKQKIIDDQQRVINNKNKEEANKLAKMLPDDRRAFTCSEKFGFRKGSDKFKDCVFKIYTAEIEMEKLELQRELARANVETARLRAEAARASDDRQERLAIAQTEAAKMQALAARQQAIASNTAESLALMESGLRMMSPQQPAPRMRTTCSYTGRYMSCF